MVETAVFGRVFGRCVLPALLLVGPDEGKKTGAYTSVVVVLNFSHIRQFLQ